MKREADDAYARKKPYTVYVLEILYITSAKEFMTVYAGLITSADGLIESPSIHEIMITGTIR